MSDTRDINPEQNRKVKLGDPFEHNVDRSSSMTNASGSAVEQEIERMRQATQTKWGDLHPQAKDFLSKQTGTEQTKSTNDATNKKYPSGSQNDFFTKYEPIDD